MGDPLVEENDQGRWRALICVMNSINRCRLPSPKRTATVGRRENRREGNYYAATVLADVTPDMTAFRQELFGPVAAITVAKMRRTPSCWRMTVSLACRRRSLPPTIRWPRRWRRVLSAAGYSLMGTAPAMRVAFGGVKKSGFGRELSHFGLHEFCNVQTVWKNRV